MQQPQHMGFNRTFMELKYRLSPTTGKPLYGFNRTFMELKLYTIKKYH